MLSILLPFFFVLGTIIGSFLNVVALRYGTKRLTGRSKCFSCGKTLRWFELLPVLSFMIQQGRCRRCKGRISVQYLLVELITGLVFAAIAWKESSLILSSFASPSSSLLLTTFYLLLTFLLWSLLIALSVYDFRHKIIPNGLVYSAALVSLILFLVSYFILQSTTTVHTLSFLDFWGGLFFAAPFALIWFFSKGRAMGLGDAKLILLFSWLLGFARGLSALIIGFWIGAAVALGAFLLKASLSFLPKSLGGPALRSKLLRLGLKTELPLGPFLVLGLFVVYVFGLDVTGLGMLLQMKYGT